MFVFLLVVIFLGWGASLYFNSPAILIFAVVFSVAMNIMAYWYSDKIVLRMAGAVPARKDTHRELYNVVENLSITAGMPMPSIYIIPEQSPNAFATGRNPDHGVVVVTEGLLRLLNRAELEGVVAHELSHINNSDILISTAVVVLVGFVAILSDFFLRWSIFGGGDDRGDGRVQAIMTVIGIALAILAPIAATLIQLAISRKREFLADASGALMTRYPEGLASALRKISESGIVMSRANHATAHLYIDNPFKGKRSAGFLNKMFMTHPPTEERVKALIGVIRE